MLSPCLSAAGVRFSILPYPAGGLGLPLGRLTASSLWADPVGVCTFRMGEMCGRGGCLLYTGTFGVLKPGRSSTPDRVRSNSSSPRPGFSTTLYLTSPLRRFTLVHPSDLHLTRGGPPGSDFPLGFSGGFVRIRCRVRTRWMVTGSNTILSPSRTTPPKRLRVAIEQIQYSPSCAPGPRALVQPRSRDPAHVRRGSLRAVVLGTGAKLYGVPGRRGALRLRRLAPPQAALQASLRCSHLGGQAAPGARPYGAEGGLAWSPTSTTVYPALY